MYKLYYVVSEVTSWYYIGMTKSALMARLAQHRNAARSGKRSKLYDVMRKYGPDKFIIVLVDRFDTRQQCAFAETSAIARARDAGHRLLNLADGGEGGFCVTDEARWKRKLSESRKGKKPASGMMHTAENKKLFSKVSRAYWESVDTYDAQVVCALPFKEAHDKHGISRSHYYRLKRSLNSEQG